ncbi:hypothetical protein L596_000431 [Steinernema carpocapsae]|uniref:Uncharacterized protein n=1 Tax=Steinernema carpocapsae TaxID=34508 RepID=A0A4U8UI54_STECR|nr:hypothetical protein L596_000431 [Steinernema carpocapsae]
MSTGDYDSSLDESNGGRLRDVTIFITVFKVLLAVSCGLCYYFLIASQHWFYILPIVSITLIPPIFVILALCGERSSCLIIYLMYLSFDSIVFIALCSFSIYGVVYPEEYYNLFCMLNVCPNMRKAASITHIQISCGSVSAFFVACIIADMWFFVIVRRCYKMLYRTKRANAVV